MLREERESREALLHDEKNDIQIGTEKTAVQSIQNYFKLPKLCDWIIAGVLIACTIATIVIVCI